jgi:hypothetical protein
MSRSLLDAASRRAFLKLSAVGAVGTGISGWMDVVAGRAQGAESAPAGALVPRRPAKNCIVLFMSGGPAHTFTFDLKLGEKGCPYAAIETSAPGLQVSEHLPHVARQMHHVAVVRGMSTGIADHGPAHWLMRTGFKQIPGGVAYPYMGSVVASEIVRESDGMPACVVVKPGSGSLGGTPSGHLGASHRALILKDVTQGIANLDPLGGSDAVRRRAALLEDLDEAFLDEYQVEAVRAKLAGYRKAVALMDLERARSAFRIDEEPQPVKDLYGDSVFGRQCLGARRLIEHGVRFVEVMHPAYWDTHGGAVEGQKKLTGVLDQPMGALLADLHVRGLLDETLVVWMGEFGRDYSGNNHHAKAWTTLFAGGGVRGGQIVGRSDPKGMTVEDRPVSVADFAATVYGALGLDASKEYQVSGRPIRMVDSKQPKPLHELYA